MDCNGLSDAQDKALTFMSLVASLLSILGSATVIFAVAKCPREKKRTYERIMLNMSSLDIVYSIGLCMGVFLTPKGSWASSKGTYSGLVCLLHYLFINTY